MNPSEVISRYKGVRVADVGVATVEDYCDSWDNLHPLASIAVDLKDVQRPWMVKAVISSVPLGGKLCEIGAGEPFVANFLTQCGYEVTVVDPYDGSGQGPTDFAMFSSSFPNIRFVRKNFSRDMPELVDGCFDAVYSISVLEHVPGNELLSVCQGIKRYCKHGGKSIHAIDHVLRGGGDAYHLEQLLSYADNLGIARAALMRILNSCELDTETYFLSAEGHNRWRGTMGYQSFPMRKVVSVNFLSTIR